MTTIWTPEYVNIYNHKIDNMISNLIPNYAIAFTDGAYSKKLNKSGYGVVLFSPNKETYYKSFSYKSNSQREIVKLCNVGAECEAVKFAVKKAIEKGMAKITIFYDYEGIYKWLSKEWNTNKDYTEEYVDVMTSYSKKIIIGFVKVKSHIGIYYNELADKLANNVLLK